MASCLASGKASCLAFVICWAAERASCWAYVRAYGLAFAMVSC